MMKSEFYYLYNTVNSFSKSITNNLKEIDEELLQALNDYGSPSVTQGHPKKIKISMGIVGVLASFVKISVLAETTLEELRIKLANLPPNSAPERDSPGSNNPFALLAENTPSNSASETIKRANFVEKNEPSTSWQNPKTVFVKTEPQVSKAVAQKEIINGELLTAPQASSTNVDVEVIPNEEESEFTALTQFLIMNVNDWREAAETIWNEKHKDKTELKWEIVQKSQKLEEKPTTSGTRNDKVTKEILLDAYIKTNQRLLFESVGIGKRKPLPGIPTSEMVPLPVKGDSIRIFVTAYMTSCHFYAQILSYGRGIPSAYNSDFYQLLMEMNSYRIVRTYTSFKRSPKVGDILIALHNKYWYRARCLKIEPDHIEVFLVDYGKTVHKKMEHLRKMKDIFLLVPFQAVEFILDNLFEKSNLSPMKSWGFFDTVMSFKEFKAEVMGNTEPVRIKMYDDNGLDMSYVLKEYAIARDCIANVN